MMEIETSVEIAAPVERVWEVLADTEAYDEWNPFITRISGKLVPGGVLKFMIPLGTRDVPVDARVLVVEQHRELAWRGPRSSTLGRLFTGEHYFRLEALPGGRTRFVHGEIFTGLLISLLRRRLDEKIRPLFDRMNAALKVRAEG
jgi:hypothetical protein